MFVIVNSLDDNLVRLYLDFGFLSESAALLIAPLQAREGTNVKDNHPCDNIKTVLGVPRLQRLIRNRLLNISGLNNHSGFGVRPWCGSDHSRKGPNTKVRVFS